MATLSENDVKILLLAFECSEEPLKIDFEKMSQKGGYKSKKTATDIWGRVKKKITSGARPPTAPSTPGKQNLKRGAGKKATDGAVDDDDEEVKPTPTPKRQKTPRSARKSKKVIAKEEEGSDGEQKSTDEVTSTTEKGPEAKDEEDVADDEKVFDD